MPYVTGGHLPVAYNLSMPFPEMRLRRLRRTESLRALVRETTLNPGDLIYPLFICPGEGVRNPVSSMPGVFNISVDRAVREAYAGGQVFFVKMDRHSRSLYLLS